MKTLPTLLTGLFGISAVHLQDAFNPELVPVIMKVLTDIIIGIATIWGMFRKPKQP